MDSAMKMYPNGYYMIHCHPYSVTYWIHFTIWANIVIKLFSVCIPKSDCTK